MAIEKKKESPALHAPATPDAAPTDGAESGPRPKDPGEDVGAILAHFEVRAQGLDGEELESEIERVLRLLVERHVKRLPERLREQARTLVRGELERDPTLLAMIEDLRAAAKRGE